VHSFFLDIFASEGNSDFIDDEGGEIVESSDTEIVGHSEENAHYSKEAGDDDSDDDDNESLGGPPPLDSEDDYEYDDSDLAFSPPPPLGSDVSEGERGQSSAHSSPAKSVSSVEKLTIKEKLARRESPDSDPGYREGPPPLDSEDENEAAAVQNGVGSHSDENLDQQNDNENFELSDEEKKRTKKSI